MKKYTSIKQLVERFELSDSEHPRPEINKASGERGGFKNLAITMTQVNGKVTKVDNNFIEYTRLRNYFNKLENNQYPSEIRITFNDMWCIDVKYEDGYFWVTYVYCQYGIFEHNTLAVTETQSYNDIEFEKVEANMYRHPQLRK
jgi:hypothetical protein